MAESQDVRYVDIPDDTGKTAYTIYSTTGKAQSPEAFAAALERYEDPRSKGDPGKGFTVLTPGVRSTLRRGFENVNDVVQRELPPLARNAGIIGAAPVAMLAQPVIDLARRAGVLSSDAPNPLVTAGATIGETAGNLAAEQVSTPGRAAMTAASAAAAPLMGPVTAATGAFRLAPTLLNMAKAGTIGATGYNIGAVGTGEAFDFGKTAEEFGIAALGGGLQSILGHFVTRFITGNQADKVAKSIVDTVAARHPNVSTDPGLLNIAGSGAADVSRMTQRAAEGLRGSLDDITEQYLNGVKNILPTALSAKDRVAWQNTARARIRSVVSAQNKMLDNINDTEAYNAAHTALIGTPDADGKLVGGALNELRDFILESFPKLGNAEPLKARIVTLFQGYQGEVQHLEQGARVLSYIRQATGNEGFNPQKFADLIRGVYQQPGNPLLERVGNILGGGRPLTEMPTTQPPSTGETVARGAYSFLKDQVLPPMISRALPSLGASRGAPQVPWPVPMYNPATQRSVSPLSTGAVGTLTGFTAQQAAQAPTHTAADSEGAEAMKRFIGRGK